MSAHHRVVARASVHVLLALVGLTAGAVGITRYCRTGRPTQAAAVPGRWSVCLPPARFDTTPLTAARTPSEDGIEVHITIPDRPQAELYLGCYSTRTLPTDVGDFRRPSELAAAAAAFYGEPLLRWRAPREVEVVDALVNGAFGPCLVVSGSAPETEAELVVIDHAEQQMGVRQMRFLASQALAGIVDDLGRRPFASLPGRPGVERRSLAVDGAARYRVAGESIDIPVGWMCEDLHVPLGSSVWRGSATPALWLIPTTEAPTGSHDSGRRLILRWGRAGRSDGAYRYFAQHRMKWLSGAAYAGGRTETLDLAGVAYRVHRWEPTPGRTFWLYHSADLMLVASCRTAVITDGRAERAAIAAVLADLLAATAAPGD